jgi:hypothetical protein
MKRETTDQCEVIGASRGNSLWATGLGRFIMPRSEDGTNGNVEVVMKELGRAFFEAAWAGMRLLVFLRILP